MGLLGFLKKEAEGNLHFDHFNFKLAIIQELMYEQEVLEPKFNAFEFCEERGLDYWEYGERYAYEIPPEIREWFEQLEIPLSLAKKVKRLYFDGGNEIYCQVAPIWDGEDDLFDVTAISETELQQFPNLRTIDGTALLMTEETKDFLQSMGIKFLIDN